MVSVGLFFLLLEEFATSLPAPNMKCKAWDFSFPSWGDSPHLYLPPIINGERGTFFFPRRLHSFLETLAESRHRRPRHEFGRGDDDDFHLDDRSHGSGRQGLDLRVRERRAMDFGRFPPAEK